ncbi:MAG TPA: TlpA disulfide reductase family protein [Planctomycetota bacterium]|nr:TlpA disulfide reductase family protein [Planctomycetota bacterium]
MANPLTGDFDAVVQIAVRQLNGLLATLHQNGVASDTTLKLLHSVSLRIGDPPPPSHDLSGFADWVLEVQAAGAAKPAAQLQAQLVAGAPPGAAARLLASFTVFDPATVPQLEVIPVKGRAELQISSVRLHVESGATSEIAVLADVRVRYRSDPGMTPLPEFIHGSVRAVFKVHRQTLLGKTRLVIQPSPVDQQIEFTAAAGSGLGTTENAAVATQIRKALREGLLLLPVDLPAGFAFSEFKALTTEFDAFLALPLQLSDRVVAPGAIHGITQSVVGSHGFAFAVSEEHVVRMIDVDSIKAKLEERTFTLSINLLLGSVSATYGLRFSSGPTITLEPGAIIVSGRVEAETDTFAAPNGFVSFKQKLRLRLNATTQTVSLLTLGEPDVDKSWFIPRSLAVNQVNQSFAEALELNGPVVSGVFHDARNTLVSALRNFDGTATASYAKLDILADGVVIAGDLASGPRIGPVVLVEDVDEGAAFSAFESWIPGGHLERMTWSWVEYPADSVTPWSGVVKSVSELHRFILPKPAGITESSSLCLRIEGARLRPDGSEEAVSGGTFCMLPIPPVKLNLPPWWEPLTVPVWAGDVAADAVLAEAVAAHVSVQTEQPPDAAERTVVLYFPDWDSSTPLELLHRALDDVGNRGRVPAAALVVVPPGALNVTRREFETRLGLHASPGSRTVHVAEDAEGGWSRTFGASAKPALFVIDGRRECVWKAVGRVDPAAAAAAIRAHMAPTPGPRFRPLPGKLAVGQRAPDVRFRDDQGNEQALHRLRGRRVVFTFWQAWSAPSLHELRRLGQLAGRADALRTVVAFHGGPPRKGFDDLRKQHGLAFSIVQDDEHRVARAFGVRCWPTTIEIDADGLIDRIQLGADRHAARGDAGPKAYG